MTTQFSAEVINGFLDSIEVTIGTAPKLIFYSGIEPANTLAANTGPQLALMVLPVDWMAPAVNKTKTISGTWTTTAGQGGTIGYYRIYNSAQSVCHEQGSVTKSGLGGDMTLDNTNITQGQVITVLSKTLSTGNA